MKKNYMIFASLLVLFGVHSCVQGEAVAMLGSGLLQVIATGEAEQEKSGGGISLKEGVEGIGGSIPKPITSDTELLPEDQEELEQYRLRLQQERDEAAREQAAIIRAQEERAEKERLAEEEAKRIVDQQLGPQGSDDSDFIGAKQLTEEQSQQQQAEANKLIDAFLAQEGADKNVNQELIDALKIKAIELSPEDQAALDKTIGEWAKNEQELERLEELFALTGSLSEEEVLQRRAKQAELREAQKRNQEALEEIGLKVKDKSSWFGGWF